MISKFFEYKGIYCCSNGKPFRVVFQYEDGPHGYVFPRLDAMKVHERSTGSACFSESAIIPVIRIRSAMPVVKKSVIGKSVVIRTVVDRCNGDRY